MSHTELIARLSAMWAQLDAVDDWRPVIRDAIDALARPAAPVVERADSVTPVVERGAGNLSDNAAPVAPAEPASEPPLVAPQAWQALADTANRTLERAERREARNAASEPAAWMTHHDEPMLFPSRAEAAQYCDDDESPIALYAAPQPAPALVPLTDQQLCSMRKENLTDDDAPAWAYEKGVRDAENAHGITLAQGEPK